MRVNSRRYEMTSQHIQKANFGIFSNYSSESFHFRDRPTLCITLTQQLVRLMRMWNVAILQNNDLREKTGSSISCQYFFSLQIESSHFLLLLFLLQFLLFQDNFIISRILLFKLPRLNLVNKNSLRKANSTLTEKKMGIKSGTCKKRLENEDSGNYIYFLFMHSCQKLLLVVALLYLNPAVN